MNVIVYSKQHCIECNILKMFLRDHHVDYEVRDCSTHPEYSEEVEKMGFLGVPLTIIDGLPVHGFKETELLKLLGKAEA